MLCFNKLIGEHNAKKNFVLWEYIFNMCPKIGSKCQIFASLTLHPMKPHEANYDAKRNSKKWVVMCIEFILMDLKMLKM